MMELALSLVIIRLSSPQRDLIGTTLMLWRRRRGGYSKSARSPRHSRRDHRPHGRHLDAGGRQHRLMPHAVVRWRLADDLSERAAEGRGAVETDGEAHAGAAAVGLAQQEPQPLDPPPR